MQQSMIRRCPECGGERVWVLVEIQTQYIATFKLKQPRRSVPFFRRHENSSEAQALTCLNCGYTALYATEPQKLIPNE
jgi:predicted nucleic-acid-binding Zn-ribbon protein